jgi:hypothetical protein
LNLKGVPSNSTEAQLLIDKYKFFYFSKYWPNTIYTLTSRRVGHIDQGAYEHWKNDSPQEITSTKNPSDSPQNPSDPSRPWFEQTPNRYLPANVPSSADDDSKGPSFDEIVELISSGKPVPGIRQIPDQLSTEAPSISSASTPPKKPWETKSFE